MHTLFLSVSFSVAVSVLLKLARRFDLRIEQAIAVNYLTAILFTVLLLRPPLAAIGQQTPLAWGILLALGVLLPSVFIIMAGAIRLAGIVLGDTAQRLSLIVPILAAFLLFGETLSGLKAAGLACALCAMFCLLWRARANTAGEPEEKVVPDSEGIPTPRGFLPKRWQAAAYLAGVWLGYGVIDILFKQMARLGTGFSITLLLGFALAGLLIFFWLLARKTVWQGRSLFAGVILGALNFGNIYFYVRAHQSFPENPSLFFAAMNMGVISLGALVGAGAFGERLRGLQMLGIALALVAIYLLIPR